MSARERTSMAPALVASAVLHGGLLAAALLFGLINKKPFELGGGVPVTLVSEGPAQFQDAPKADEEQLAQSETPEDVAVEPEPPPPAPAAPPTAPPKPSPDPAKKPQPTKPARPTSSLDFDRLLSDVQSTGRKPAKPAGKPGPAQAASTQMPGTSKGPSTAAKGYLLTLGDDLGRRWNPNCLVEGGSNVQIKVKFVVLNGGRLLAPPTSSVDTSGDSMVQAARDRAKRAVRAAEPFPNFPPELYGQEITVNFNAREICGR